MKGFLTKAFWKGRSTWLQGQAEVDHGIDHWACLDVEMQYSNEHSTLQITINQGTFRQLANHFNVRKIKVISRAYAYDKELKPNSLVKGATLIINAHFQKSQA